MNFPINFPSATNGIKDSARIPSAFNIVFNDFGWSAESMS